MAYAQLRSQDGWGIMDMHILTWIEKIFKVNSELFHEVPHGLFVED
jgi:hypothetical protein